jgi:hypothetical protein
VVDVVPIDESMRPLFELPQTFVTLYQQTDLFKKYSSESDVRQLHDAAGIMLALELVERGYAEVDLEPLEESAPCDDLVIHTVPDELTEAYAYFLSQLPTPDYKYEVYALGILGEYVTRTSEHVSTSPESIQRLKDALTGGVDEWTGLEYVEAMFPEEGYPDKKTIDETVWADLPEPQRTQIDELRTNISGAME